MKYKEIIQNKPHNPNYILREFDENLAKIMDNGYDMDDRTGTGCRYLPGITTTIDISQRVPVPTLRATRWKSMLAEYLWFLTGSDLISELRNQFGSKVWDSWQKPEWADSKGLSKDSIGYGYGPNLVRYGQDISDDGGFEPNGFNQVNHVVNLLKTNPNSRRILWSFFRPDKQGADNVVLDPCHLIYQWIPEPNRKLSCCVYIRSNDMFIGALSTNLQGAAFYTYMLGQICGFTPSKLIVMSAHAHIYNDHFPFVEEYLKREEVNSPILKLNKRDSMYSYTLDDFELEDYNPLPKMKIPISV
jgi:thymidylate synthase